MDSIDCMASIDCYSFSEHILVYVFVSLIGVYMSRGGPTRTAYSIFYNVNLIITDSGNILKLLKLSLVKSLMLGRLKIFNTYILLFFSQ